MYKRIIKNREGINKDVITFSDTDSISNVYLGKKSYMFAIETCTNRLDITLQMKELAFFNYGLRGAMIYYEREINFSSINRVAGFN